MNILICEEESVIAEIISNLFQKHGHIIYIASNSWEAVHSLKNKQIDVLITDYNLVLEQQHFFIYSARKNNPDLKIIILSSLYTDNEKRIVNELRANQVINKPFSRYQLELALNEIKSRVA